MTQRNVVVVGGGLAGLCCARTVQRAGHSAHVYEASGSIGGRVRTDHVDGFLLDRGFQVLFTAYPAVRQEMDLEALNLRAFAPGALVCWNGGRHVVADPLRVPIKSIETALSPLFPLKDKLLVARLTLLFKSLSVEQIFTMPDQTMGAFLQEYGFSSDFIDRFIRPFYGGIFLEGDLSTSVRMFAFVFKMLAEGQTVVPEKGMGAIPQQFADTLAPGTLHVNSPVQALTIRGGRVVGIELEDESKVEADVVVLATEFDKAAQLAGLNLPAKWRVSNDISFALPEPLYREKLITLFTDPMTMVNNATLISNIAPSYAPEGQHLLTATVLGGSAFSDEGLADAVRKDISAQFPDSHPDTWRLLRVCRIREAQFAQPVGIWDKLPSSRTPLPGLILAGEITVQSSLHGALISGQRAAGLAMSVKA
jgi:phytoene dehydrogenase-like protein